MLVMDEQFAKVKTGGGGLRLKGEKVNIRRFLLTRIFGLILTSLYRFYYAEFTVIVR